MEDLKKQILDFELDNQLRIKLFEEYFQLYKDDSFELLSRISGMYQFSGIKVLEKFLYDLSENVNISLLLNINCCRALLLFYELDDKIFKWDSEETIKNKKEFNNNILIRNNKRKDKAYVSLNNVLKRISNKIKNSNTYHIDGDVSITYYIDLIYTLLETNNYDDDGSLYFYEIIENINLDSDYRYKKILMLENKNIIQKKKIIKESCLLFLCNIKNITMYRILSAQYLLQNCLNSNECSDCNKCNDCNNKEKIQNIILSFTEDNNLEYDVKADAADLLLVLGTEKYKILGRNIITKLGKIDGNEKSIYDDKQNLHNKMIEDSIKNILEVLLSFPIMKIGDDEIDFNYVVGKIYKLLKIDEDNCNYDFEKIDNIKKSLNRVEMDRSLYLNTTMSKILIKLYSYIQKNNSKDEMEKRLLEELEEMAGKCSSGFVGRLCNVVSGFGDLNINVSFEDQLIGCFIGRLNFYAKKIDEKDSIFYNTRLYDVLQLYIKDNNLTKNTLNISFKKIIDDYLKEDRELKINNAIQYFKEKVIDEMTVNTIKFNERKNFSLFFGTYLPNLRQELWEEFKDFMDEFIFDLTIRKAISTYEGIEHFI